MKNHRITRHSFSLIILSFLIGTNSLYATTIDEAAKIIVDNNSDLIILRTASDASLEKMRSEGNLSNPEIDLSHLWGANKESGSKLDFSASQEFKWPTFYSENKKLISSKSYALDAFYQISKLEKLEQTKVLLIDYIYSSKLERHYHMILQNCETLLKKYTGVYNYGESTLIDVNKLKLAKLSAQRQLDEIRVKKDDIIAQINIINGGNACDEIIALISDYPNEVIKSREDYYEQIETVDPDAKYNKLMSAVIGKELQLIKADKYPSFLVGYQYLREGGTHYNGIKFGFTIPAFSTRHRIEETMIRKSNIDYTFNSRLSTAKTAIISLRTKALNLVAYRNEYREIIQSSDNESLLKKSLEGGQISLLTYMQEINYFFDAIKQLIDINHELQITLAHLNKYDLIQ